MRRAAALAFAPLLAAAVALTGCGSSSSSTSATDPNKSVTVTGGFGQAPKVTIPKAKASGTLYTKTLIQGTGEKLTSTTTEGMIGNIVAYDWSGTTNKLISTSYAAGNKAEILFGKLPTGIEKAIIGQQVGSRVLAVVPPKDGFDAQTDAQAGIGTNDTLVFVIDMNSKFSASTVPGTQTSNGGGALPTVIPPASSTAGPTVKINTKAVPPKTLQVKTLIKGTGPVVKKGDETLTNYNLYIWRTGKSFQSTWSTPGQPYAATVGSSIPGWDTGLTGQTVGSRVLLVIPPAQGYGKAGKAPIKGTDTLVFVVDILAAI